MYNFDSRVRFSETDQNGYLTIEAIVDYFQDCSTFQSEDLGVGASRLREQGLFWVLSYWQICVEEYPALGEKITVGTLPYEFKGFLGKRNFCMEKEDGTRIVSADSLWTLLNCSTGLPAKVPKEISEVYPMEEKLPMEYAPRKIAIEGQKERKEPITIQIYHLDCNHHVNNGQYIKIAGAFLPEEFTIKQMRVEYKKQARLGEVLCPVCYTSEHKKVIVLEDTRENPVTIVEFTES